LWDLGKPQVIINAVPEKGLRYVRQRVGPALAAAGLPLVGVIPQDRALLGMSVGDLARALNADVLCAADNLDQPVEAVMIAAMADEGAESYFRRVARKAVVAGGDRPDVHLPALATDTSCIVLTEGKDPDPTVLETAADQGVPLLKVGPSTLETLDHISDALRRARFRQRFKLARAVALVQEHVSSELLDGLVRTGDGPAAVGEAR
jgi:BioD-like phosphotransacetylase family protein